MNETKTNVTNQNKNHVQRNYKDTVFRMLFREKENLLDLLYVTRVLQNRIKDENLYSKSLIKIPAPRFVVFYNGMDFQPEQQVLYLSDAFEKKQDKPSLELTVIVYNINLGHNHELLEACRLLKEYAQYVAQVRTFAGTLPLSEAVEEAVNFCIDNGILSDFLLKNRAEAIAVSIFEYDEEKHMKSERKEWREIGYREGHEEGHQEGLEEGLEKGHQEGREEGREEGRQEGREEGLNAGLDIFKILMDTGNLQDVERAFSDSDYRKQLFQEYFSKN